MGGGGWVKEPADGVAGPLLLLAAHLLHQPLRRVLAVEVDQVVVVVRPWETFNQYCSSKVIVLLTLLLSNLTKTIAF